MVLKKIQYNLLNWPIHRSYDLISRVCYWSFFESCTKFPEIAGGTNSVNSVLTKLSKGKIFFKNGAEGVFVAIIPELKSALVVKIADGATRAAEVAVAGLISELKMIDEEQLEKFKKRSVTNSANQIIGYMNWSI